MTSRRLIVQTGDSTRELLFIGKLTVGRATECDISLNDGKVSRRHAEFDATGPSPRVTDLGSRNGMLVNDRKVTVADIDVGDVVVIGDARIVVEAVADDTGTAPAMAGSPPGPATVAAVPAALAAPPDDERTAVLPRPVVVPPPAAPSAEEPPVDERTAVIPRSALPRAKPPVAESPVPVVQAPVPPPAVPVVPAVPPVPASPSPPSQVPTSAPAPAPAESAARASGAPASTDAAPVPLAAPRFSWSGMVMLLCVGLGALATLLAAVPLLSSSTQSIDALSTRQARTLVGWLSAGASRDLSPTTTEAALQNVLRQDGVVDGMVLDASTGQVVAPIRLAGRSLASVPGTDGDWRAVRDMRVSRAGGVIDAVESFTRGDVRHLAWVRYEVPSTSDQSLALIVALIGTMVLAFVASLLVRRQTSATMGLFTRQVELAVSGADVRVMRGDLLPGLERLPGIVAYLLEQRKSGGPAGVSAGQPGILAGSVQGQQAQVAEEVPAWIIVTPSLSVTETSPHAPASGIRNWASGARGRHLLDTLEPGPMCNAVVQGLGALSNAPGAALSVPVDGTLSVMLRREAAGHVRIELPMR